MKTRRNLTELCLLTAVLLHALTSVAQPIIKVAAGGSHSLFLKSDGSLWAMGFNGNGQLGDGTYNDTNRPEQVVPNGVLAISGGSYHSLFMKTNGSLWAMGKNLSGELGDGTYATNFPYGTNRAEQVVASNVTAIATGGDHSLFLKTTNSLWGMGWNQYGQLGDGSYNQTNLPEQIIVASNVTAIASKGEHSLFLKNDGSLWAMGANSYGQLGDGSYNNTNKPEQIVASNIMAIATGYFHSLFLKNDGSLWGMGFNYYGQLGDGTYTTIYPYGITHPKQIIASNVTAIAAGDYHSLFLKSDGSLWAMGGNGSGQLGDGTTNSVNRPEQIVASSVTAIAAGAVQSLFIKSDGSLWAMGANNYGQLGDGTTNNIIYPKQVVAGPPGYNLISGQLLSGSKMQLSFMGITGAKYALDRSSSLASPNWLPQATNPANSLGALIFTNTPNPATNNFWRIRSVP
jgi:alpha-tubulin suppressor-like RCC1 family protein